MVMLIMMLMVMLMVMMINCGDGCNADGDDNDGKVHEKKYCMNGGKNDRSYLFIVSTQERGS